MGIGAFGLAIVGMTAAAGAFGFLDVIILGGAIATIVVGVRRLRGR